MSEGADFDACHRRLPSERYSFEARTTEGFAVLVKDEEPRLMDEHARAVNDAFDAVLGQRGPAAVADGLEELALEIEQARL